MICSLTLRFNAKPCRISLVNSPKVNSPAGKELDKIQQSNTQHAPCQARSQLTLKPCYTS